MLITKRANPRALLNYDHPVEIDTDTIRIICGLDSDAELMRAVTRQSRWRDKRRPPYLTKDKTRIEDYPELEEARQRLNEAWNKARTKPKHVQSSSLLLQIQRRAKEVRNTWQRLQRALRHRVRREFDEEQAFLDIEAQLSGTAVKDENEELL